MRRTLAIIPLWLALVGATDWDEPLTGLVREANELYAAEQFVQAQEKLEAALKQRPNSRLLHFNLGGILYRLGDFNGALAQFQGALGDTDDQFASKVYYNIGDCQYRLQHLPLALDAYKKAARLDPTDRDARVNLEIVAKALAQTTVSQKAKDAYAEALKLVEKRLYRAALDRLGPVVQEEPAAAKRYGTFVRRLQQIAELVPPAEGTNL